jgi:hypothetical protein
MAISISPVAFCLNAFAGSTMVAGWSWQRKRKIAEAGRPYIRPRAREGISRCDSGKSLIGQRFAHVNSRCRNDAPEV